MNDEIKKAFFLALAQWARAVGKPRPESPTAWQRLIMEYRASQPVWNEILTGRPNPLLDNGASVQIVDPLTEPEHDEFYYQVLERERALEEAGGDDLARDVIVEEQARDRIKEDARFARLQPPSVSKAQLGQNVSIAPLSGAVTQPFTVAFWTADTDAETCPVAIALGVIQPPAAGASGTALYRPYAIVQYGSTSYADTFEVDVGLGGQLVVPASFVKVDLALDAATQPATPAAMQMFAMLSFFPTVRVTPMSRTKYIDSLAAAASKTIVIPKFAKDFFVIRADNAAITEGALQAQLQDSATNIIYTLVLAGSTDQANPIRLPGDATTMVVKNTGGNTANFRVIFGLAL